MPTPEARPTLEMLEQQNYFVNLLSYFNVLFRVKNFNIFSRFLA